MFRQLLSRLGQALYNTFIVNPQMLQPAYAVARNVPCGRCNNCWMTQQALTRNAYIAAPCIQRRQY